MTPFARLNSESDYQWDTPLLIFSEKFEVLPAPHWERGEAWIEALDNVGTKLLGVVLPLELKAKYHWRQSLHGLELLEWLRYSTDLQSGVNLCPVLAASWQPLQDVLKRRLEPLVVSQGCFFARLPEALRANNNSLRDFVQKVRGREALQYAALNDDLRRLAFGRAEVAENLTHHDLANDFFAAWRLWAGYLKALEDVSQIRTKNTEANKAIKLMMKGAKEIKLPWQDELKRRIKQPYFRQFCLSRERINVAPYPAVESAPEVIRLHAQQGLPPDTRILLVDDEFEKGMADVLLQLLFGRPQDRKLEFTTQGPLGNEWVYSVPAARQTRDGQKGDRWARMVCVKDTTTAALWLRYWGEVDLFNPRRKKAPQVEPNRTEDEWTYEWSHFMDPKGNVVRESKDIFGYQSSGRPNLDKDVARPKAVTTFVLLDLRLKRDGHEGDESSLERDSKQFLDALKSQRPDIPVLMLTASRQTNTYTEFMGSIQDQEENFKADGWLIKEAPDAMTDDSNSSRAVYYLLDFIHLSAQMNKWYRTSIGWDQEVKQAYHEMWSSPFFHECLKSIDARANTYLLNLQEETFREHNKGRKLLGSVQQDGDKLKFDIEDRLVARRIAIWALLFTADWSGDYPTWNVTDFLDILSCMPVDITIKYPSSILNFKTDLYLGTYTHKLLERLLKEEYDWLEQQAWRENSKIIIINYLKAIRAREGV